MKTIEQQIFERQNLKVELREVRTKLNTYLIDTYQYSLAELREDRTIFTDAKHILVIKHKCDIGNIPFNGTALFENVGVHETVMLKLKECQSMDDVLNKMNTLIDTKYEAGVKYITTNKTVSDLVHRMDQLQDHIGALKIAMNTTYGNLGAH